MQGLNKGMPKRLWEIRGYDSTTEIFKTYVSVSCFSEKQIQQLLKALAARAGLTFDEIIDAYTKKNSTLANDLLVVRKEDHIHSIPAVRTLISLLGSLSASSAVVRCGWSRTGR